MSVRLRLTVIYSGILALTLVLFGAGLYGLQARTTLQEYENRLSGAAKFLSESRLLPPDFERFAAQRIPRQRFPGQPYWIVRNVDGTTIQTDPNLEGTTLPLNDDTRQKLLSGERDALDIVTIDNERFLIHSQMVHLPNGKQVIAQIAVSLAERDRYLWRLGRMLTVGSGLVVLVAFGIGWVLAGVALRPIDRVTHTAQAIGAEQDFNKRVDYVGPADEVGRLATTFNDMLARLQSAYQQIEDSLHAQKQFVADASHELRTPLTTIRGNLELLQRNTELAADEQADILADVATETDRLIRLVHNLLVLARADAKQMLPMETVLLEPVVEEVKRQTQALSPAQTILLAQFDPELALQANRDALKQVLLALLDNVVQHTPSETTVAIAAKSDGDQIIIDVMDDGPGIDTEQLAHVFERFYRCDPARSGVGVGLGLAIVKELVEAQGGSITAESSLGQGTSFRILFPRMPIEEGGKVARGVSLPQTRNHRFLF